eukprot:TRINITY_DN4433_c0_g1_i2.p1 TRINITY_DN4433_c0_g1~~TRINITY_DN4433_c0_g1_i2.p1  ORF type:complete len:505 (-),score=61.02 TRINITY_DN4433_c0_g1_i2:2047-3561(-)
MIAMLQKSKKDLEKYWIYLNGLKDTRSIYSEMVQVYMGLSDIGYNKNSLGDNYPYYWWSPTQDYGVQFWTCSNSLSSIKNSEEATKLFDKKQWIFETHRMHDRPSIKPPKPRSLTGYSTRTGTSILPQTYGDLIKRKQEEYNHHQEKKKHSLDPYNWRHGRYNDSRNNRGYIVKRIDDMTIELAIPTEDDIKQREKENIAKIMREKEKEIVDEFTIDEDKEDEENDTIDRFVTSKSLVVTEIKDMNILKLGGDDGVVDNEFLSMTEIRYMYSRKRLLKDFKEVEENPIYNVSAAPLESDLYEWHCNIAGHPGSVFANENVALHLIIKFPASYPNNPPTVQLGTPVLGHPNVFGTWICLDMLQDGYNFDQLFAGWTSAYTVQSVLVQLQSFLFELAPSNPDYVIKTINRARQYRCVGCGHNGTGIANFYPPFKITQKDMEMRRPSKVKFIKQLIMIISSLLKSSSLLQLKLPTHHLRQKKTIRMNTILTFLTTKMKIIKFTNLLI